MAEYAIVINAEDIAKATVYTDISIKEALARGVAQLCVEPVDVISDDTEALPPMFRENRKLRAQFQMGILASLLGREYEKQTVIVRGENGSEERPLAWCMDEDDYRKWASSHVMNQLERMKKAKGTDADRIFDFLYDYKAIELMISGAIRDELEAQNDPFNRAMRFFTVSAVDGAVKGAMAKEMRDLLKTENAGGDKK